MWEMWLKVYQHKRERILKRDCLLAWRWAARQTVLDTYPEIIGQELDRQNDLAQLERDCLEADIRQLEQENAHLEEMLRQVTPRPPLCPPLVNLAQGICASGYGGT